MVFSKVIDTLGPFAETVNETKIESQDQLENLYYGLRVPAVIRLFTPVIQITVKILLPWQKRRIF